MNLHLERTSQKTVLNIHHMTVYKEKTSQLRTDWARCEEEDSAMPAKKKNLFILENSNEGLKHWRSGQGFISVPRLLCSTVHIQLTRFFFLPHMHLSSLTKQKNTSMLSPQYSLNKHSFYVKNSWQNIPPEYFFHTVCDVTLIPLKIFATDSKNGSQNVLRHRPNIFPRHCSSIM